MDLPKDEKRKKLVYMNEKYDATLKTYELKINPEEDSFVDAIGIVAEPAIESDFIAFSSQTDATFDSFSQTQSDITFKTNNDKMELLGAAMIPDLKIFRQDASGEKYNVVFKSDTIRQIAQTYFQKGFQSNLNLDHTATPAKSFVYQSYIVDSSKGVSSPKGLNLPDGSWVVGVKVTDPQVWEEIKSGKQKGFSVEGVFQYFKINKPAETNFMSTIKQTIIDTLSKLLGKNEEVKEEVKEEIKEEKMEKVYSDAELNISAKEVGGKVELVNADGTLAPAPDGEYKMQDGFSFTCQGGQIAAIAEDKKQEPAMHEKQYEELKAEFETLQEQFKSVLDVCVTLKTQNAELKTQLAAFTKQVGDIEGNIKTLAKIPVKESQTSTSNVVKDKREEAMLELAKIFAKPK